MHAMGTSLRWRRRYISVRAGTYIGTYEAGHNNMSSLLSGPQTVGN